MVDRLNIDAESFGKSIAHPLAPHRIARDHRNHAARIVEMRDTLAQELNQPIAAAINDPKACLRRLTRDPLDLTEAREAAACVVADGTRAPGLMDSVPSCTHVRRLRAIESQLHTAEQVVVVKWLP